MNNLTLTKGNFSWSWFSKFVRWNIFCSSLFPSSEQTILQIEKPFYCRYRWNWYFYIDFPTISFYLILCRSSKFLVLTAKNRSFLLTFKQKHENFFTARASNCILQGYSIVNLSYTPVWVDDIVFPLVKLLWANNVARRKVMIKVQLGFLSYKNGIFNVQVTGMNHGSFCHLHNYRVRKRPFPMSLEQLAN